MTYSASHQLLAPVAKMLDASAMDMFCKAANEASDLGYDHNACVTSGWSEVKKNYSRPPNGGKWMRKEGPDAGDVHVDVPMGGKKPKPDKETGAGEPDDELMEKRYKIRKVDETHGIVYGWAIVCSENGSPYFDLNVEKGSRVPENITEDCMVDAAVDFAKGARPGNEMHSGPETGSYYFVFPMTADIAKSFGFSIEKTGLMCGYKPGSKEELQKFIDGTYTGFSIEGSRVEYEMVD